MILYSHMEMFDILNSDGKLENIIASKKDAHEKGLWHRAAHIWFINSKGEILLQKRAEWLESYPGKFDISAAGHLSAGDTKIAGALREVEEELGIKLDEKDLIHIGEIHNESTQNNGTYINKEYNDIYVVHKDIPISNFKIQESEVSLVKYILINDLKELIKNQNGGIVNRKEEFEILFKYLDNKKESN